MRFLMALKEVEESTTILGHEVSILPPSLFFIFPSYLKKHKGKREDRP